MFILFQSWQSVVHLHASGPHAFRLPNWTAERLGGLQTRRVSICATVVCGSIAHALPSCAHLHDCGTTGWIDAACHHLQHARSPLRPCCMGCMQVLCIQISATWNIFQLLCGTVRTFLSHFGTWTKGLLPRLSTQVLHEWLYHYKVAQLAKRFPSKRSGPESESCDRNNVQILPSWKFGNVLFVQNWIGIFHQKSTGTGLRCYDIKLYRIMDLRGGPEPSKKLIRKVLSPIGRFHFYIIPVLKQIWPYHPTWYISQTGWSVFRSARR